MKPFTFRRCLLLCAPALLIGLIARVLLTRSIPEGFYGADSNSYFETAWQWWVNHRFVFEAKRRGLYPLLELVMPLLPGNSAQGMVILQHFLGLVMIVAIGWITGNVTRFRAVAVPVVTCLCAILPRVLWYEHEMIADSMVLVAFTVATALAFPTRDFTRHRLLLFLLGALLLVTLKPHGRPIWLGLVVAAVFLAGNPLRWGWKNYAALAAAVFVILGTGSSRQGGWLFLSSALPLVNTEGSSYPEHRAALKPVVDKLRDDWRHYPWIQKKFKKPLGTKDDARAINPEWAALVRDQKRYAKATKRLAIEAVLTHPFQFAELALTKIAISLSSSPLYVAHRFDPATFWKDQAERNDPRWERNEPEIRTVYEMDQATYRAMVAERVTRRQLLPERLFEFLEPLTLVGRIDIDPESEEDMARRAPALHLTWFAGLALLGVVFLFVRGQWRAAAVLLLPAALYVGLIYSVGDAVARYILAVEWLGFIFAILGVDGLLWLVTGGWRKKPPVAEAAAPVESAA